MSADTLAIISYVAFACAFFFLVLSIVLYVKLDIKAIIDDLSGKRAERQIQAFREQNANQQRNVNILLGRTDDPKSESENADEDTVKLNTGNDSEESELTERLYNETMLLEDESDSCWKLILNEMVVHTGETI